MGNKQNNFVQYKNKIQKYLVLIKYLSEYFSPKNFEVKLKIYKYLFIEYQYLSSLE